MNDHDEVAEPSSTANAASTRPGCRCDECCAADRDYQTARRAEPRPVAVTLEGLPPLGDWVNQARCRTAPTSVFFPERGDPSEPAKQICRGCPVMNQCRDWALDAPVQLVGIWGGLSAKQRRDARLTRRISA